MRELAGRITVAEFLDWLAYLDWLEARQGKMDFYLAQIAAEVRKGNVKHPNQVKIKDFMVEMKKPSSPVQDGMAAKAIWLKALNVTKN